MLTKSLNNTFDWYLLCNYSFSDKWIKQIKSDVKKFMVDRQKDNLYYDFLNWTKKDNEIMVLTMYAHADIQIPKPFNIIFQLDNVDNFVETKYIVTKVILNGWTSTNQIAMGHKHITILEFETSIPDIFNLISDFEHQGSNKKQVQLGFCDKEHFEIIKTKINEHSG